MPNPETILLCAPVSADELAAAKKQFPQFDWRICTQSTEAEMAPQAEIIFGKPACENILGSTRLKWVQSTSAGVEPQATSAAFVSGTFILTTAAGMHASCAEHAMALLLGVSRRVGGYMRVLPTDAWKTRALPTPLVLEGRTLGIIGLGAIGKRVALMARAMGMRTIGVSYRGAAANEVDETHAIGELDRLLPKMDAVVLVVPATKETDNLLDARRIALLPRHCIVVNVGRGNAIDEPALINALKEDRIAGAGLDVFVSEPPSHDSPLYILPNVVMTPHIGGNRPDYDAQAFGIFIENLNLYVAGKPLRNVVERARGY